MHLMTDTLRVSGRLLPGGPRNAIAFHGHQDANLRRPLATSTPTRPFEEPDRREWVQTKLLHLIGDFSQPAILQDMSGNSIKISKTYFQNCTAEFESRLVRQQVIDIAEIIVV